MQIAEIRSELNAGNTRKGMPELPESTPDWALRHIYERRNGLPVTSLPAGIERRSTSEITESFDRAQRAARAQRVIREHNEHVRSRIQRLRLAILN